MNTKTSQRVERGTKEHIACTYLEKTRNKIKKRVTGWWLHRASVYILYSLKEHANGDLVREISENSSYTEARQPPYRFSDVS